MTGWAPDEIEFYKKYGRRKPAKKEFMQKRLKGRDKAQRFDSADFELKKQVRIHLSAAVALLSPPWRLGGHRLPRAPG